MNKNTRDKISKFVGAIILIGGAYTFAELSNTELISKMFDDNIELSGISLALYTGIVGLALMTLSHVVEMLIYYDVLKINKFRKRFKGAIYNALVSTFIMSITSILFNSYNILDGYSENYKTYNFLILVVYYFTTITISAIKNKNK